jgi:SP family sugar:H+ symporter-like MFS transporter
MHNFEENFGNKQPFGFSTVRSGLIVGMLSIGSLFGALVAGPIANTKLLGRKYSFCFWNVIFCVGVIVQIISTGPHWYQVMIGRIIAGLGIGALSVIVPHVPRRVQPGPHPRRNCLLLPALHHYRNSHRLPNQLWYGRHQ